jgi:hypothetical protein
MAADPLVRVFFHLVLTMPQALPGSHVPWYCTPDLAHVDVPTPSAVVQSFERELRRYGTVTDNVGFGTWTVGDTPAAGIAFEEGDHIVWIVRGSTARRVVPIVLRQMRVQLDQRETLAEIVGGDGVPADARTRIVVTLPFAAANYTTLERVHRIFGDAGRGGATQTSDAHGVEIASGVIPAHAPDIEAALRRAGFRFATAHEAFITSDAPACPTRKKRVG